MGLTDITYNGNIIPTLGWTLRESFDLIAPELHVNTITEIGSKEVELNGNKFRRISMSLIKGVPTYTFVPDKFWKLLDGALLPSVNADLTLEVYLRKLGIEPSALEPTIVDRYCSWQQGLMSLLEQIRFKGYEDKGVLMTFLSDGRLRIIPLESMFQRTPLKFKGKLAEYRSSVEWMMDSAGNCKTVVQSIEKGDAVSKFGPGLGTGLVHSTVFDETYIGSDVAREKNRYKRQLYTSTVIKYENCVFTGAPVLGSLVSNQDGELPGILYEVVAKQQNESIFYDVVLVTKP